MNQDGGTWRRFVPPLMLVLAAAAALGVDLPIARSIRAWNQSPTTRSWLAYFDMFEFFGYGLGVAVLLLAIHQLDPARRWAIPRVLACVLAAGGMADLLKMLVLRIRPYECPMEGCVWATFGSWLPLFGIGSPGQSFPSAHTATAAGFAAALVWLYPQGRLLFFTLAALVGCQRMACEAHYLSDVLVGAATGYLTAQFLLTLGRLPAWFEQRECGWKTASQSVGESAAG
jgi:membrane-associated phospholipid phosphatase